ncbi:hypothetical protein GIB67_027938 [Kingdonia uniflora]|uniref:S-protein homolog n=1 Tax=Kingdonia uniflora TaxID=39325 RepID=A0A7J7LGU8_9MAGN|nr:hypothetical protein GIB67_027938 [Kingdonia uniflora]
MGARACFGVALVVLITMGLNGGVCLAMETNAMSPSFNPTGVDPDVFGKGAVNLSVTNDLAHDMNIHCKSKNDDLGDHKIGDGGNYNFQFQTNLRGTSLFWCNMSWLNEQGSWVTGGCVVFDQKRDKSFGGRSRCMGDCKWIAKLDGIYQVDNRNGLEQFMCETLFLEASDFAYSTTMGTRMCFGVALVVLVTMGLNGVVCSTIETSAIIPRDLDPNFLGHGKVHLIVTNQLGTAMNIHCRSKDNDLGIHRLDDQQVSNWNFETNYWGTTLFWCSMAWMNPQGFLVKGSVTVFDEDRDGGKCMGDCRWYVKQAGVYRINNIRGETLFEASNFASLTTMEVGMRFGAALVMLVSMALYSGVCSTTETSVISPSASHKPIPRGVNPDYWGSGKVNLIVTNSLGPDLNLHCKSKSDDLGDHTIGNGGNWSWKFETNFWGTTLFWCNMSWLRQGSWVTGSCVVFDQKRDQTDRAKSRCTGDCKWFAKTDGIYQVDNRNGQEQFM